MIRQPDCPNCLDTGYLFAARPRRFGEKIEPQIECECQREKGPATGTGDRAKSQGGPG